jgi:hypothetical protein
VCTEGCGKGRVVMPTVTHMGIQPWNRPQLTEGSEQGLKRQAWQLFQVPILMGVPALKGALQPIGPV